MLLKSQPNLICRQTMPISFMVQTHVGKKVASRRQWPLDPHNVFQVANAPFVAMIDFRTFTSLQCPHLNRRNTCANHRRISNSIT